LTARPIDRSRGTGQLGEIEDLNFCRNTYPVVKVRALMGPPAPLLAAVPAIRWSVASAEDTDQGFDGGPDTRRRLEDQPANRRWTVPWDPRVVSGFNPSYSVLVWCCLAQVSFPPLELSRSGGDEETRTPDPLLAKEMLCQLSYVPPPPKWWWAFLDSNQRPLPYQGSALTS
jgi:hypothetical protein